MLPFARTISPGTYPVLSALTLPSMGALAQHQQQSTLLLLPAEGCWKIRRVVIKLKKCTWRNARKHCTTKPLLCLMSPEKNSMDEHECDIESRAHQQCFLKSCFQRSKRPLRIQQNLRPCFTTNFVF